MTTYVSTVLWMVLSPIAVLTDFAAIFVICHYRPFHHGTDITLVSLMVSMAVNAIVVLPVPAIIEFGNFRWNPDLCQFYVWAFITFRIVQLLNLVFLIFNWTIILKFSVIKKQASTVTFMKSVLPLSWMVGGVIGILPVIGATDGIPFNNNSCVFLSYDISLGFGIFFAVFSIVCFIMSFVCSCDALALVRAVRKVALIKYGAGRFHLPRKRADVPGQGMYTLHERYSQLSMAWDLCKLAAIVILVSFGINHLPYTVIQFLQITSAPNRQILEEVVLWLILVESLILPHALWCFSKRYRHALVYTWKVHICRNSQDEEDPSSCTLQSYLKRTKEINGRATLVRDRLDHSNQPSCSNSIDRRNVMPTARVSPERLNQNESSIHKHKNGVIRSKTNDIEEGIATVTIENQNHKSSGSQEGVSIHGQVIPMKTLSMQLSSSNTLQINAKDLKRTSSACSRKEWKDQMIKKHLPAIFVNEAFDTEENIQHLRKLKQAAAKRRGGNDDDKSLNSMYYYVSSDYHPDNLNTDSLHRKRAPRQESDRSESDGIYGQYDEVDIEHILDNYSGASFDSEPDKLRRQNNVSSDDSMDVGNTENGFHESIKSVKPQYKTSNKEDIENISITSGSSEKLQNESIGSSVENGRQGSPIPAPNHTHSVGKRGTYQSPIVKRTDSASQHFDKPSHVGGGLRIDSGSASIGEYSSPGRSFKDYSSPVSSFKQSDSSPTPVVEIEVMEAQTNHSTSLPDIDTHYLMTESYTDDLNTDTYLNITPQNNFDITTNAVVEEIEIPRRTLSYDGNEEWIDNFPYALKKNNSFKSNSVDIETKNTESALGVSIGPYTDEQRYPPWLRDLDSNDSWKHMDEPLLDESDMDSLQSSYDSNRNKSCLTPYETFSPSNSPRFDKEVDQGFEEALAVNELGPGSYVNSGLYFDSIKEESEDALSFDSQEGIIENEAFRTQAIVSKSRSETSSSCSENPFDSAPSFSTFKKQNKDVPIYANLNSTVHTPNMKINSTDSNLDSANGMLPRQGSPWPESEADVDKTDMQFESNFGEIPDVIKPSSQTQKESTSKDTSESQILSSFSDIQPVYF